MYPPGFLTSSWPAAFPRAGGGNWAPAAAAREVEAGAPHSTCLAAWDMHGIPRMHAVGHCSWHSSRAHVHGQEASNLHWNYRFVYKFRITILNGRFRARRTWSI
eukprot:SAG22_NODE_4994_length_1113_cov_1.760355_2_plen_103_part_01